MHLQNEIIYVKALFYSLSLAVLTEIQSSKRGLLYLKKKSWLTHQYLFTLSLPG